MLKRGASLFELTLNQMVTGLPRSPAPISMLTTHPGLRSNETPINDTQPLSHTFKKPWVPAHVGREVSERLSGKMDPQAVKVASGCSHSLDGNFP